MLIKELKEVIKDLPDDADVVMQSQIKGKMTLIEPTLATRLIKVEDGKTVYIRLVLMNMKPAKEIL